eukprot:SAG11_NODE_7338_length_1158_cov_4.266289_1_plen_64_part_01
MELLKSFSSKNSNFFAKSVATSRTGCPHTKYWGDPGKGFLWKSHTNSTGRYSYRIAVPVPVPMV